MSYPSCDICLISVVAEKAITYSCSRKGFAEGEELDQLTREETGEIDGEDSPDELGS